MLPIEINALIDGFWESIKEEYPQYSKAKVEIAIRSFFNYIKVCMKDPSLPEIRVKYFGHFYIKPGKAQAVLKYNLKVLANGRVDFLDTLRYRIDFITKYLQKHAPEKLTIPYDYEKGKGYTTQCVLLPSGEFEIQPILQQVPAVEEPVEETHKGADRFPDFLHGLNMLFGR